MRLFDGLPASHYLRAQQGYDATYHRMTLLQHFVNSDESLEGLDFIRENRLHAETGPERY